ncbi:hypothetical protein SERLA73DRAFT_75029 [Serpula lacrymans var. lacrymans S7.3]|uniref:Uncharacterized protein n=2 Tax=Serpula lacrymans var. lacrymans TaxID=341189 RepID=F8Q2B5_SERL3|nr:uncharacterized protein SERLADRAFT_439690 [Serpula lacrymans var. lacrymans S7.9]EGN97326.1 hypothetical protein SERLA73DRAFT_75029 [Serpula lacrymans var. lacrymans S7.3]EGO22917.1 hypothetical protein SERLADRAFT_439690 [Serpula lacrymans var. lacrymans S7.9]
MFLRPFIYLALFPPLLEMHLLPANLHRRHSPSRSPAPSRTGINNTFPRSHPSTAISTLTAGAISSASLPHHNTSSVHTHANGSSTSGTKITHSGGTVLQRLASLFHPRKKRAPSPLPPSSRSHSPASTASSDIRRPSGLGHRASSLESTLSFTPHEHGHGCEGQGQGGRGGGRACELGKGAVS